MFHPMLNKNEERVDSKLYDLFDFKPSKGDLKRMEIVLAAIQSLATLGLDKTTYESIAKIVGTGRAHINYYFKDKDDIFLASVKYISANYQQTSIDHIEKAQNGKEMLLHYIEGPFLWAIKNPEELSVMLLFYYLCTFRDEYRELNDQIRKGGTERIQYILTEKNDILKKDAPELAKAIQNHISGAMMDAATTKGRSLVLAEKNTKEVVMSLIKSTIGKDL